MGCLLAIERSKPTTFWAFPLPFLREHSSHRPTSFQCDHVHRTGDRRLRLPQPNRPYVGTRYAQDFGKSCPQQAVSLPDGLNSRLVKDLGAIFDRLYEGITPSDEDCEGGFVFFIKRADPFPKV